MSTFTRIEIARTLEIEEDFVAELEREEIIRVDAEAAPGRLGYSESMLERARVAHSLVHDLEINMAGVAVIVRMREELGALRAQLRALHHALRERGLVEGVAAQGPAEEPGER